MSCINLLVWLSFVSSLLLVAYAAAAGDLLPVKADRPQPAVSSNDETSEFLRD